MKATSGASGQEPQATYDPLDDYDPQLVARVARRPTATDWPRCRCGAAHCPDLEVPS
ncbi:hypothetical protein P3T37_000389 [Kitasatospora sp. MAA4]|uniref:hypothetical protein n=1 Tax=Kitasatospora sp. MAA4 TaxID=3035093 RepID=UPI002473E7DD|nr:hypothetical protein [Kitasatospora sp. MAA4]MDH6131022.1 hypothetical protein [Kitasatospora sp. MAA4]